MTDARLTRQSVRVLQTNPGPVRMTRQSVRVLALNNGPVRLTRQSIRVLNDDVPKTIIATASAVATTQAVANVTIRANASATATSVADDDENVAAIANLTGTASAVARPTASAGFTISGPVLTYSHRCELHVYDKYGSTLLGTVEATNVKFSTSLGGNGFLSADVSAQAEPLLSNPSLLDDCVIKLALPISGDDTVTEVLAYANRARNGTLWSGAGTSTFSINASSLWTTWAQDARLFNEANQIPQLSLPERYFGWMSSIYDYANDPDYDWGKPSAKTGKQKDAGGVRAGNPDGWPTELGDAYWITRPSSYSNGTRHLFVADVVVPSNCYLTVYFSADETCSVYFGGENIIQWTASETGYETVATWSGYVTYGTYRIGIDKTSIVSRGGDGVDPVLLAVATNNDDGSVKTPLIVTNNTQWKVYTLDPDIGVAPSLTPGEIALELHRQAKARGVNTWDVMTTDFTARLDSAGLPWPQREERMWRIGYDRYLDMFESLGDLKFSPQVTKNRVLQAFSKQGQDVSNSVTLEVLQNVAGVSEDGVGVAATVLLVETMDGWTVLENANAKATYGRREESLSLGNAPSIAQGNRLGQEVLDSRLARATTEMTIQFYAKPGAIPFVNFNIGDTVTVKIGNSTYKKTVLDIGGSAASTKSIMRYEAKVGEVVP